MVQWTQISDALYHIDPMGLGCRERELVTAYDAVARDLVRRVHKDKEKGIRESLEEAFVTWFGDTPAERDSLLLAADQVRRTVSREQKGA